MLERRSFTPWLASFVIGAVCLSLWQMIGCPGPPNAALFYSEQQQVLAPIYTLLTAANASAAEPAYDLERLPMDDYTRLVDLTDFRFLKLSSCNESASAVPPLLLVLVHSAPGNFLKRQTIRSTWGSSRNGMRLIFLLGKAPEEEEAQLTIEQRVHGDVVQGNFRDAYRNMTYKHVMALKYAAYHCPRARYVLKTDDDVFVNMPTVIAFLSVELSAYGARRLLLCRPVYDSMAKRSYRSKWRVSYKEYPNYHYPTYCPGWALLYSPDVVFSLYREAQKAAYFWIDDVLITGIMAKRAHLEITPLPRVLLLSRESVDLLLRSNDSWPSMPYTFLYGPLDMRRSDMYALWNVVSHYYTHHHSTTAVVTDV